MIIGRDNLNITVNPRNTCREDVIALYKKAY